MTVKLGIPGILFTPALNGVGLALTTETIPSDMLVVDHADVVPTEN